MKSNPEPSASSKSKMVTSNGENSNSTPRVRVDPHRIRRGRQSRVRTRQVARHQLDDKVAIVTLTGDRTPVTSSDVYDIAIDKGAAVCKVDDNRGRRQLDLDNGPEGEIQSADKLIEEKLADQNLVISPPTSKNMFAPTTTSPRQLSTTPWKN